jgi:tetratricopeptide (TPR) repeat protein
VGDSPAVSGAPPETRPEHNNGEAADEPSASARAPRALPKAKISFASDVYALGAILYHTLTGRPPFIGDDIAAVLQQVLHEEPLPSRRLNPSVPDDLETICLKCLEKEPSRRYQTSQQLADDLGRFLNDEPIFARPPSAVYRFQKFVRRHRAASVAVASVTLALLLGVIVSTGALVRERAARKQADQRLKVALGFVDQVVTNVAPEIMMVAGATEAQKKLLQSGLTFMERLRESAGDEPGARVVLARLLLYMSERQNPGEPNTSGDYETALKRAEEALDLLRTETPQLSEPERLGLLWQGKFAIVQCLIGLGRFDEAVARSKEMDPLLDRLEQFPERARRARRNRMMIRSDRGWATILAGRRQEALDEHLLPLLNSGWARSITDTSEEDELLVLMIAHDNAGNAYALLKQFDAMLPHAEESVRLAELLRQRFPESAFYTYTTAQNRAWLGYALLRTGRIEPGLAALRKAREEIEARAEEASSEAFRRNRMIVAAVQALAFAGWSEDASASLAERQRRLTQAEAYLVEAEEFARTVKAKSSAMLTARAEVPAARAKLEADQRAQTKP